MNRSSVLAAALLMSILDGGPKKGLDRLTCPHRDPLPSLREIRRSYQVQCSPTVRPGRQKGFGLAFVFCSTKSKKQFDRQLLFDSVLSSATENTGVERAAGQCGAIGGTAQWGSRAAWHGVLPSSCPREKEFCNNNAPLAEVGRTQLHVRRHASPLSHQPLTEIQDHGGRGRPWKPTA